MIFLTGGTGFLGRNLVPMLVERGFTVRLITRHPAEHPWLLDYPSLEVIQADVTDREAMFQAAQGCRYVIHAAGKFSFWGQRDEFEETNVCGSQNVMDAAVAAQVEKYIHISTVVVIGHPTTNGEIDETHPVTPIDPYQKSKYKAEQVALKYYHNQALPVVVLRPGAFYGPYGHYAFNQMFFEDPLRGLPIGVNGGRYFTFPAYIKDVAQSVILALEHGKVGEIYHICSQYMTHREVDRIIAEEAGIRDFHIYFPQKLMIPFARFLTILGKLTKREPKYPITLRSYILNNWCVSTTKAQRELGFKPTPFRQGVQETLEWYREMGIWKGKKHD